MFVYSEEIQMYASNCLRTQKHPLQVYLLTRMDCATLFNTKSNITLHTEFNYQATSVSW